MPPLRAALIPPPLDRLETYTASARYARALAGAPDTPGVPLLADRPLLDGGSTAYVCRGFVCDLPVTTAADLAARLRAA